MNQVNGKVSIVTGAGSGIGREISLLLAEAGSIVVTTDIDKSSAEETVGAITENGGSALAIRHDVSDEQEWQEVVDETIGRYKKLDVLVNNAGIIIPEKHVDTSYDNWRKVLGVNLDGTFLGMRSAIRVMKDFDNVSSIINICSVSGLMGDGCASYSASKGGVRILTKSAAVECGRLNYGIRVNAVYPGSIDTPLNRQALSDDIWRQLEQLHPLKRFGEPSEIAKGVLFLASDDSSFITGSDLVIDGGMTAGVGGILIDLPLD